MTKLFGRESLHRSGPALLTLFAATAALAAGAQALSPAAAPALQVQCVEQWECDYSGQGGQDPNGLAWESGSAGPPNRKGVGADNGFGQAWSTGEHDKDGTIAVGDPFADQKGTGLPQSNPPGLPTGNSGSFWESMKKGLWRRECKRLRREIKGLIRDDYGDDADFDEVSGSGDPVLEGKQDVAREMGCGHR
jgi:hypothetical protein